MQDFLLFSFYISFLYFCYFSCLELYCLSLWPPRSQPKWTKQNRPNEIWYKFGPNSEGRWHGLADRQWQFSTFAKKKKRRENQTNHTVYWPACCPRVPVIIKCRVEKVILVVIWRSAWRVRLNGYWISISDRPGSMVAGTMAQTRLLDRQESEDKKIGVFGHRFGSRVRWTRKQKAG